MHVGPISQHPRIETDRVDSHRTPGHLYDKPKHLRLIWKGDDGLLVLRGRRLALLGR